MKYFFFFVSGLLGLFCNLQGQEKQDSILPKVVQFSQDAIDFHEFRADTFVIPFQELIFWDNADIMTYDYVRSLGQVGKPHEVYHNGLPISYNNDPFLNQNQLYFWDIEKQSLFLNTRTPFIRAKFNQSGNKTQNFGLILSRNINPFWNTTLKSQRRTSVGAYLNNVTDHWNIHLTTHYLSKNQRHFIALSAMLHDLKDNLNGGTYQDGSYTYETSFNQNAQPILLRDAKWIRQEKSLFTQYSLKLNQDTVSLYWALQASLGYQWYKWSMYDEEVDSGLVARSILHNPFGFKIINGFLHEYELEKKWGKLGIVLHSPKIQSLLNFIATQNHYKGNLSINQQRNLKLVNRNQVNAFPYVLIEAQQWVQYSDIFVWSNQHDFRIYFNKQDTLQTWKLSLHFDFQNQNPSLRDRYSNFAFFRNDSALKNVKVLKGGIKAEYIAEHGLLRGSTYLHKLKNSIFFNPQAQLQQYYDMWIIFSTQLGIGYQWKNFLINSDYHYFLPNRNIIGLTDRTPQHILSIDLIYKKLHFKKTIELNIGFKNKWLTTSQAYLFEHAGFFWYPFASYYQKAVLISDFYASAKFKKALIFIRLNNLLQDVLYPGYYTTYYHPMVNRSLNLGITWDFTD